MDPRRRLISLFAASLGLCSGLGGCAVLDLQGPRALPEGEAVAVSPSVAAPFQAAEAVAPSPPVSPTERPYLEAAETPGEEETGRRLTWASGRVFAVQATPLRVTVLVLPPGETLVSKAAGDTVRWRIGEARSGEGEAARALVLLKPLERGLSTNLVLTTNKRLYLVDLTSVSAADYDPIIFWKVEETGRPAPVQPGVSRVEASLPSGRYVIEPRGRAPRWTPTAVHDDGRRTTVEFPAELSDGEAPALFEIGPDGERRLVAWRQAGRTYVADRLFERAELRLGVRRPQIVRIRRLEETGS